MYFLFCILIYLTGRFSIMFFFVFYSIMHSILYYSLFYSIILYYIIFYLVIYSVNSILQYPKCCEYFLISLISTFYRLIFTMVSYFIRWTLLSEPQYRSMNRVNVECAFYRAKPERRHCDVIRLRQNVTK